MNLFRGAALTSGFPHVHLFMFLVLAEKDLSILQYNPSRGAQRKLLSEDMVFAFHFLKGL